MLVSFGQNSLTNALGQHQQITIRILDKHLLLTGLAVACLAPDFAWTKVDRPILASEIGQNRVDIPEVNLKHRTLPKRRMHRPCLESAMTLAKHDLLAFRVFQVNELFLFTPVGNFKADDFLPESEADVQVGNVKFRYNFGPARSWRCVPVGAHINDFPPLVRQPYHNHHDTTPNRYRGVHANGLDRLPPDVEIQIEALLDKRCHCEEPTGRRFAPPEDRLRDEATSTRTVPTPAP